MRRAVRLVVALVLLPIAALVVAAVIEPFPAALRGAPAVSIEIADRHGKLVREVRTESGALASRVTLESVSASVVPALLAAEDARFHAHPGVDPLAMARAFGQLVRERRVVSGASTITQQLARTVVPHPRTLLGKLGEIALALRIEASLDKKGILEAYLSRVEFGPNLRGIDAASRWYLDKPARALDLAEAAALVAIPRGPAVYDPRRSPERVLLRRDRILERMRERGLAAPAAIDRALSEPLRLQSHFAESGMDHLALALARGGLPASLPAAEPFRRVQTTLDARLQEEVLALTRRAASDVARHDATALAVVVVDNATASVLAYVGSPDYFDAPALGANDGVRALRQPGSTLKPFVYAAAMETLGTTAATLLPDVELTLSTPQGPYSPRNYDGRFHGPVRLRQALASSLNIPAVATAARVGPARILGLLRRAGFTSLDEAAERYGAAIALGDGEVRLAELAEAYCALARGGERWPLSLVQAAWTADGRRVEPRRAAPSRVVDARIAAILTDVLADEVARAPAFGRGGALELPFPVAAKTGTSKGYRDNWTVGFTHEVTVAVWVGNFDGTPMTGSTGVMGAGPLFHDVMLAAMRGVSPALLVDRAGLVEAEVCALSGERPGPGCTHHVHELFRPGEVPTEECSFHAQIRVDPETGLRAGPDCGDAVDRIYETYPSRYLAWAAAAGRPLSPRDWSPRCPDRSPAPSLVGVTPATVRFPRDGARFALDRGGPERQEIVLAARAGSDTDALRFVLDGRSLGAVRAPYELPWELVPGRHSLAVEAPGGERGEAIVFEVADAR